MDATAYLDTSSAYFKWSEVDETIVNLPGNPQYPDGYIRNGYFLLVITPRGGSGVDDFIDVFFYVGLDGSLSAWVEDSDGNEYTVDVTMVY